MLISADLQKNIEGDRFVAKQFLHSVLNYMNSSTFQPKKIGNPNFLKTIMLPKQIRQEKSDANSIY